MRRRRYAINPAIEDLNRNRATSNYNASQINTNTGANLAYRLQSAVNTDRAIASLRSQESNVNKDVYKRQLQKYVYRVMMQLNCLKEVYTQIVQAHTILHSQVVK